MRCKHCNARLAAHDMWCVKCGKQSPAVITDLALQHVHAKLVPADPFVSLTSVF